MDEESKFSKEMTDDFYEMIVMLLQEYRKKHNLDVITISDIHHLFYSFIHDVTIAFREANIKLWNRE